MAGKPEITNLEDLIERMAVAAKGEEKVSLGRITETIGRRAFGPLLLFAGLITVSPLSGVPGLPSTMGILVLLVAVQLLMGRRHFWLPRWLLKRGISSGKLCAALRWCRRPARFIDRFLKVRLTFFTHNSGTYFMAALCALIAAGMPLMELVPFSTSAAGLVLALFGLALIAHDGLLAVVTIVLTIGVYAFLLFSLLL